MTIAIGSILPVGTIIHSMLTVAQFESEYGTNWVIADGRSVTGTLYATVTGNTTIPDMRGRFLRGKNNGGTTNPDGDLALGTLSADKYTSHTHSYTAYTGAGGIGALPGLGKYFEGDASGTGTSTSSGGNETAPKAVTVNIFIRIN
jgi:hypothetical protein